MIGIYKIKNKINGHSYIGQSKNIEERWKQHIRISKNKNSASYNYPLYQAFRKYGIENFEFSILKECLVEQLTEEEDQWISREHPKYNQTSANSSLVTSAILSEDQVKEIQQRLLNDKEYSLLYEDLAEEYQVSVQTISDINTGRSWANSSLTYPLRKRSNHTKQDYVCIDCGKPICRGAVRCVFCQGKIARKVERPNREELKQLIRTTPFTRIGIRYEVSDNAVRKWCDSYNLPRKTSDIKKFSDAEWQEI